MIIVLSGVGAVFCWVLWGWSFALELPYGQMMELVYIGGCWCSRCALCFCLVCSQGIACRPRISGGVDSWLVEMLRHIGFAVHWSVCSSWSLLGFFASGVWIFSCSGRSFRSFPIVVWVLPVFSGLGACLHFFYMFFRCLGLFLWSALNITLVAFGEFWFVEMFGVFGCLFTFDILGVVSFLLCYRFGCRNLQTVVIARLLACWSF